MWPYALAAVPGAPCKLAHRRTHHAARAKGDDGGLRCCGSQAYSARGNRPAARPASGDPGTAHGALTSALALLIRGHVQHAPRYPHLTHQHSVCTGRRAHFVAVGAAAWHSAAVLTGGRKADRSCFCAGAGMVGAVAEAGAPHTCAMLVRAGHAHSRLRLPHAHPHAHSGLGCWVAAQVRGSLRVCSATAGRAPSWSASSP